MELKLHNILRSDFALCVVGLLTVVALTTRPGSAPPIWWDEGWALSIARNWIDTGHYGLLRNGEHLSPGMLTSGFPLVAPIALSFKVFGIGLWQARAPGVLYTLGTLLLLYMITRQLYDRSVAMAALLVALMGSPLSELNPVLIGRQALGEMPALFFLLLGYVTLLRAPQSQRWLCLTAGSWGVSILAKPQVLPFLFVALLIPGLMAAWQRQWRPAAGLAMLLLGAILTSHVIGLLLSSLLQAPVVFRVTLDGHYGVSAVVLSFPVRIIASAVCLLFAVTTVSGLTYAVWSVIPRRDGSRDCTLRSVVALSLLSLSTCWLIWYVCLSAGWPRYLFPPLFVGSIFAAALLRDLTGGFRELPLRSDRAAAKVPCFRLRRFASRLVVFHLLAMVPLTIIMVGYSFSHKADASLAEVSAFLNSETPANARIETYDTELFFLIDRSYHYPPDEIAVLCAQRVFQGDHVEIKYDLLNDTPDYLVIGPFSRLCQIYSDTLKTEQFRFVHHFGLYTVYERVHRSESNTDWEGAP